MNNNRRRQIKQCIKRLQILQNELNGILDEEQESFDNMPEGLQSSLRAIEMEKAISNLELAIETIDDVISFADNARC